MKEARWMPLLVVVLALGASGVMATSKCPDLSSPRDVLVVRWSRYTNGTCGVHGRYFTTVFEAGDTKSFPEFGNECLKFTCGAEELYLNVSASGCKTPYGCSKNDKFIYTGGTCTIPLTCQIAVVAKGITVSSQSVTKSGFTFYAGYGCGKTGANVCGNDKCFNPVGNPIGNEDWSMCIPQHTNFTTPDGGTFTCQMHTTCDKEYFYLEMVRYEVEPEPEPVYDSCSVNGTTVVSGTVTWSDPCRQTVCTVTDGIAELVTAFKDHEGCVHEQQCVKVDGRVFSHDGKGSCTELFCRKDSKTSPPVFEFDAVVVGCRADGKCYTEGTGPDDEDGCTKQKCLFDSEAGHLKMKNVFTGSGCFDLTTNTCSYGKWQTYTLGGCIKNRCNAAKNGKWLTRYRNTRKCKPISRGCKTTDGLPGCKHQKKCYPVKSVITWDDCAQYVCYSDDTDLNNGINNKKAARPMWRERATGCYGPKGCMKLGEQFVDPNTRNTYRCTYKLGDRGLKYPQFHKSCETPDGRVLALGESARVNNLWYSCNSHGRLRGPVDPNAAPDKNSKECGQHAETGQTLYEGVPYVTRVATCIRDESCNEKCRYFDQPCKSDGKYPDDWRFVGDKFNLDDAECVCTQDYEVNNQQIPGDGSLVNTPSLCGERGVKGGACRDPIDSSVVRQWGELWERSGKDSMEVCTCHPLTRSAFCSDYLPQVISVLTDMKI
ncbi:uncharacterized protein LOC143286504 [Babylonia areolata]|uniref:uncharacterized protein LOC143286504 n=1 Tax=Babylonia areolata TaxID=304850 RepID=UPI003FD2081A